jgi:RNA polymerase sigma-70 factor (ECF subfamily)
VHKQKQQGNAVQKISFNELIENYSNVVLRTAARILGDTQQAQDVHQEVFLEIWRRWHKYDGRTNWNAYLYRTTVRSAIRFAKKSRIGQLIRRQPENFTKTSNPDENLRTAELQQKLAGSLAKLPKRQAEVFVLSRIEDLENEKIAGLLGCSQKTVRVHLHRAVKQLAGELSDYFSD